MALGFDVYEDDRSFEKEGLTDKVQRYVTSSMSFPCFVIINTEDKPVKAHSIDTLKRMFKSTSVYTGEESDSVYIYFNQGDQTVRLGIIGKAQVKTFLRLFECNFVDGYIDEKTKLEDKYLYVLA